AIAPAAAAAASPSSASFAIAMLVRTVAALRALRLGRLAVLVGNLFSGEGFSFAFGNRLARLLGRILGRSFMDRNMLAVFAAVAPIATAASAAATAPPATARFAFAVLGYGGGRRFDVLALHLHLRLFDDAFIFQIVF